MTTINLTEEEITTLILDNPAHLQELLDKYSIHTSLRGIELIESFEITTKYNRTILTD